MKHTLRMTQAQHQMLRQHLFIGDGLESVALLVCGHANGTSSHVFTVREVVPIPVERCIRRIDSITWPTSYVDALLQRCFGKEQAIIKVHSHPGDYRQFSRTDDISDTQLFASITSLLDDGLPHASVIMLPDGSCMGRALGDEGRVLVPLTSIMVVGDDLLVWPHGQAAQVDGFALRHAQAFGKGTVQILRGLTIVVVGCSGTGSVVIEQLARLGAGKLILIDPDFVEEKNLNRILNSGRQDIGAPKVEVLARAIRSMDLGVEVVPMHCDLLSPEAVAAVAEADVAFGCMDGTEGRHLLNRIATFYNLPYFDVGVRLDADGTGGIERIAGGIHYLQPGLSSLLSRGVYTMKQVEAEGMRRTNPELYRQQVNEGYLRGVEEDRPAVISVNMTMGSLVVNEFLARIHPHRNQSNDHYAQTGVNLSEMQFFPEPEGATCELLRRHVGKGDTVPLLERPALS
jgi:hypothetical protein